METMPAEAQAELLISIDPTPHGGDVALSTVFAAAWASVLDARFGQGEGAVAASCSESMTRRELVASVDPGSDELVTLAGPGLTLSIDGPEASCVRVRLCCDDDSGIGRRAAEDVVEHFASVVTALVSDPDAPASSLPKMGHTERARLVHEWNSTEVDFDQDVAAHVATERWAIEHPDDLAFAQGERRMTYGEFRQAAANVTHWLRASGLEHGDTVGLLCERGIDFAVGAFGVLRAGGAYVPIEPAYPADRVAFMLADCGARLLLTDGSSPRPDDWTGCAAEISALPEQGDGSAIVETCGSDLAYVVYTSGSTGRPKGVMVEHAGLANLISWHRRTFAVLPGTRCAMAASPAFDVSVWELWPVLVSGASLHVVDERTRSVAADLAAWLDDNAVEQMILPTPLAEALLAEPGLDRTPLRVLITGGDRLRSKPAPGMPFVFYNVYGPAEVSVVTSSYLVESTFPGTLPPIGKPVDNLMCAVLDPVTLELLPTGAVGELFIGGIGVARGYYGRPELTAERFVTLSITGEERRFYRSGDLVRWNDDGELQFLERTDDQLKVRGCRIEPGEIEAALLQHPDVAAAAVVAVPREGGDSILSAFIVRANGDELAASALRKFLRPTLPQHMIPSVFIPLDEIPLTVTGKVDRKQLRVPAPGVEVSDQEFVAPRDQLEETLAELFAEMLGMPSVGIHDDFLALGGDSLRATRLLARVAADLDASVSLRTFYEDPTVAALAAIISSAGTAAPRDAVTMAHETVPTRAQERLWFVAQHEPGNPVYNISWAFRFSSAVDRNALERAINLVVARHDALRMRFPVVEGRPTAVVLEPSDAAIVVDAVTCASSELDTILRDQARRPYDLASDALLRALIVDSGTTTTVVVSAHHIVVDGWSSEILFREIAECYAAIIAGLVPDLPALQLSYQDVAESERAWCATDAIAAQTDYWRGQLAGLEPLELPTDHARPQVQSFRGSRCATVLPAADADALKELARESRTSLFMVLLAALKVVLARYTGQEDVAVACPVGSRRDPRFEQLVGLMLNTVILRTDLGGNPSYRDLLARVRDVVLDGFANVDVPFEKVVEALRPQRDLSRNVFAQVMLTLHNQPSAPLRLGEEVGTAVEIDLGIAQFDLALDVYDNDEGLVLSLEYASDLFERGTAQRFVGHLARLLGAVAAGDADTSIGSLPLLTESEQERFHAWNGTTVVRDGGVRLHDLFAATARRTPERIAAEHDGQTITYAELDRRSDGLARQLVTRWETEPGTTVVVCLTPSLDSVAAVLGVLKAGAAYVPLDPAHPSALLADMIADCGAAGVVTTSAHAERLPAGVPMVAVDVLAEEVDDDGWAPPDRATGTDLAHIFYTSGSTGRPKGVLVEHRSICNRLEWMARAYEMNEADRVPLLAPLTFDVSLWEMFAPWMVGGRVVIPTAEERQDPSELCRLVQQRSITMAEFVPSMLQAFLAEPAAKDCTSLTRVLCGSETLTSELVQRFHATLDATLYNVFGPTETAIDSLYWRCDPADGRASVPIGGPIDNTRLYVLDRWGGVAPVGVPGELLIAGVGVARGYLNRPELTERQFVPEPAVRRMTHDGDRAYRTGDRVRWLADGVLEFLGRIDRQVKIRGMRVEPGEVEAAIARHPAVRECVVVAQGSPQDESVLRLVAYCTLLPEHSLTAGELRAFVGQSLPAHMVPALAVFLDELPLTNNGKVDRAALPSPTGAIDSGDTDRFVAPRNAAEAALVDIWQRVLGIDNIGVRDDFFTLGGDSILSVQVVALAAQAGVHLTTKDFFEEATVAHLASIARPDRPHATSQCEVVGEVPLTPIAHLFFEEQRTDPEWFNDTIVVEVGPDVDRSLIQPALAQLAKHHDILRGRAARRGGSWRQWLEPAADYAVALDVVDVTGDSDPDGRAVEAFARAQASLQLEQGPVVRAVLVDRGPTVPARLMLLVHHLFVDAVSWRVLLEDFATVYDQMARGLAPDLGAKTTSFKEWAARLTDASQRIDPADIAYWTSHDRRGAFSDALGSPAERLGDASPLRRSLSEADTEAVLAGIPARHGTRINDALLTALVTTIRERTGDTVVRLDLEGHGREHVTGDDVDVSRTVGWFTSVFPLELHVDPSASLDQTLLDVQRQLKLIPSRGVTFGMLRYLSEDAEVRAALAALPPAPIMFNYAGQFDSLFRSSSRFTVVDAPVGSLQSPRARRAHPLEVECYVMQGLLRAQWSYDGGKFTEQVVADMADRFFDVLRSLTAR
jgi:amino acid adenylation domain-containing protein/non-ribosomal peptide synthase protein (TIGR01720 family)